MSTKKMRCLVKRKEESGYDFVEQDIPVPQEGELLVKCIKSSICGSDINLFVWNDSKSTSRFILNLLYNMSKRDIFRYYICIWPFHKFIL